MRGERRFDGSNFDEYPHFFTRLKETCGNAFTASIVAWTPIQTEIVSDADWSLGSLNDVGVANEAVDLLTTGDPDVLFLHLDQVDGAGHGFGFSPTVPQYLNAIENVDDLVGDVMDAIESRDTFADESWLVRFSTDHGGIGTSHGGDTPEERTIFVIVSGSAAEQGALISPAPDIVDIPATVMAFLEVPIDPAWDWDGVPVGLSASPPPSEFPCVSCPRLLYIQADQVDKTVQLTWSPGAELDATALELYRAGELIATLALDTDEYLDTPPIGSRPAHEVFDYELRVVGGVDAAICAPLVDRAILSNGDVRLAEDFDDAVDDGDLLTAGWSLVDAGSPVESATWTIDNPAGRANPPEFDGSPTTGRRSPATATMTTR